MKLHRPKACYWGIALILMGAFMGLFLMEEKWKGWDWWARYDWLLFIIFGLYGIVISFMKVKGTEKPKMDDTD